MATCARCGAGILWKRLDEQPFAVDLHEVAIGHGRYVERGEQLVAVRMSSEVLAYVDHRLTCRQ